jgi:RHS repeat-associated protein
MLVRDRATTTPGTLNERLWEQQDANWNTTALVDGSGIVQERYTYDSYGVKTVYDGSYTVRGSGSSYASVYLYQGMRFDSISGLDAADLRWYSPTLQTWSSLDPLRFAGGDYNLDRFEDNNSTNKTDPLGLATWLEIDASLMFRGWQNGLGLKLPAFPGWTDPKLLGRWLLDTAKNIGKKSSALVEWLALQSLSDNKIRLLVEAGDKKSDTCCCELTKLTLEVEKGRTKEQLDLSIFKIPHLPNLGKVGYDVSFKLAKEEINTKRCPQTATFSILATVDINAGPYTAKDTGNFGPFSLTCGEKRTLTNANKVDGVFIGDPIVIEER